MEIHTIQLDSKEKDFAGAFPQYVAAEKEGFGLDRNLVSCLHSELQGLDVSGCSETRKARVEALVWEKIASGKFHCTSSVVCNA